MTLNAIKYASVRTLKYPRGYLVLYKTEKDFPLFIYSFRETDRGRERFLHVTCREVKRNVRGNRNSLFTI